MVLNYYATICIGLPLPLSSPLSQGVGGLNKCLSYPSLIYVAKVRKKSETTKFFRNFFQKNYMKNSCPIYGNYMFKT